jgi:hypothetical protein
MFFVDTMAEVGKFMDSGGMMLGRSALSANPSVLVRSEKS